MQQLRLMTPPIHGGSPDVSLDEAMEAIATWNTVADLVESVYIVSSVRNRYFWEEA